jgi:CheY-like chemotaxis protein
MDGNSGRILVVDDEEMVRRLAKTMLIKLGYEVVTASNGIEAVEIYRSESETFDLIVLDMVMPGMDGQQCFLALKSINPDVRAVISSGYSQEGSAQETLDEGVRGFVQKPYRLSELSSVIEKALAPE